MKNIYVLGISALYHNSAAALICNGEILYAAEEERFTRKKADSSFPIHAICFCLDSAGITPDMLYSIAYYENSIQRFARIITSAFLTAPKGIAQFSAAVPEWISNKLWIEKQIRKQLQYKHGRIDFLDHHLSHAASAYYPSPFHEAAILTIDGVGEWATASWGVGEECAIQISETLRYPNSLGLLYSAFTNYTGFKINDGEYKMMGLAPYGQPKYVQLIQDQLIHTDQHGAFVLNQRYFSYTHGLKTINQNFESLFGAPARKPNEECSFFYADVAASIQSVTEDVILRLAQHVRTQSGKRNLTFAGGVALNVCANSALQKSRLFDHIWIQPAAGDAGCAIGAALEVYYRAFGYRHAMRVSCMPTTFLGVSINDQSHTDDNVLHHLGAKWTRHSTQQLCKIVASLLKDGKIIGVARDKAEFGPRALGNRSILADARSADMLQKLNLSIKFREGFRPFAPVVLEDDAADYFEMETPSPFMLFTYPVQKKRRLPVSLAKTTAQTAALARSDIPAVTHVDYSARVQTVNAEQNPFLAGVLEAFKKQTGYSVLINTSFNTNGEPIVNSVEDAYRCFMRTNLDFAVIGDRLLDKREQTVKKATRGNRNEAKN